VNCLCWVISGQIGRSARWPLYPRLQTFGGAFAQRPHGDQRDSRDGLPGAFRKLGRTALQPVDGVETTAPRGPAAAHAHAVALAEQQAGEAVGGLARHAPPGSAAPTRLARNLFPGTG
jgi:hypothetical protein